MFFLLTDTPGALLPTVVSRCLRVRFHCLEQDQCAEVLERRGIAHDRAELLSALAQGSVGRALEIDADKGYMSLRSRVIDAIEGLKGPESFASAADKIGIKDVDRTAIFEIIELWARDLMRVQNNLPPMQTADAVRLRASHYSGSRMMQILMQLRKQLKQNVSWTNALDTMFFCLIRQ